MIWYFLIAAFIAGFFTFLAFEDDFMPAAKILLPFSFGMLWPLIIAGLCVLAYLDYLHEKELKNG